VREGTVSNDSAENLYSVVIRANGSADATATTTRRKKMRKNRVERSRAFPKDDADDSYLSQPKTARRVRERLMTDVQQAYTTDAEAMVREIMDSGGRLLEVQVGGTTLERER
jgi:hypothetical protein